MGDTSKQLRMAIDAYRKQNNKHPEEILINNTTLDQLVAESLFYGYIATGKVTKPHEFMGIPLIPNININNFSLGELERRRAHEEDWELFKIWARLSNYDMDDERFTWKAAQIAHASYIEDIKQSSFIFKRALSERFS